MFIVSIYQAMVSSTKLTSPISIREMAEFVHSHDPIPNEKKKVLLAYSMGAMVSCRTYDSLYQDAYQAAFLMNTSVVGSYHQFISV